MSMQGHAAVLGVLQLRALIFRTRPLCPKRLKTGTMRPTSRRLPSKTGLARAALCIAVRACLRCAQGVYLAVCICIVVLCFLLLLLLGVLFVSVVHNARLFLVS